MLIKIESGSGGLSIDCLCIEHVCQYMSAEGGVFP